MPLVLLGRRINRVRVLLIVVRHRPALRALLPVLLARKAPRRVHPALVGQVGRVARVELDAPVDFLAPAVRPAPVGRVVVLVVHPVPGVLVAQLGVLAGPLAPA